MVDEAHYLAINELRICKNNQASPLIHACFESSFGRSSVKWLYFPILHRYKRIVPFHLEELDLPIILWLIVFEIGTTSSVFIEVMETPSTVVAADFSSAIVMPRKFSLCEDHNHNQKLDPEPMSDACEYSGQQNPNGTDFPKKLSFSLWH